MNIATESVKETQEIAKDMAMEIAQVGNNEANHATVIALEGELGAGKTTFIQGFAKGLKIDSPITSPTFVIFKIYPIGKGKYFKKMIHVDCYRLRDYKDLEKLNFKEVLKDKDNIVAIEWSDRVGEILPEKYIKVHIDHLTETERRITIS